MSGNAIAVGEGRSIDLIDIMEDGTATLREHLEMTDEVTAVSFRDDGASFAVGTADGSIWARSDGQEPRSLVWNRNDFANELLWDDDRLAVIGAFGTLSVLDTSSDLRVISNESGCTSDRRGVSWSHTGSHLAAICDGEVRVWDETGTRVGSYQSALTTALMFSPVTDLLAVGSSDGYAQLVDLGASTVGPPLPVGDGEVWKLGWSGDGTELAAAVPFGVSTIWYSWSTDDVCDLFRRSLGERFITAAAGRLAGPTSCEQPTVALAPVPTSRSLRSRSHLPRRPLEGVAGDVDHQVGLTGGVDTHSSAFADLGDHSVRHRLTGDVVEARGRRPAGLARVDRHEAAAGRIGHGHVEHNRRCIGGDADPTGHLQFGHRPSGTTADVGLGTIGLRRGEA